MKLHTCNECNCSIRWPTDHHGMCPNREDRPEQYYTDEDWIHGLEDERDAYFEGKEEDEENRRFDRRIGL